MLSSVNPTLVQQAYQDLMDLNGKKTSELSEYELRLVDFFTKRYPSADRKCIRSISAYPLHFLSYHGAIDLSEARTVANFDLLIHEDKEVSFPAVRIHNSRFAMDVAFKSIFEPEYQPLRYYKSKSKDKLKEFNRIRHTQKTGYYMCKVVGYMSDEPEFWEGTQVVELPPLTSLLDEKDIPEVVYNGTLTGDSILYKGNTILIDQPTLPYTRQYAHNTSQAFIASTLAMWSHIKAPAPEWVKQALAHSDEDFVTYLSYLGMELGDFNREETKSLKPSSNSAVKAISVGLNGFKQFMIKRIVSPKRTPPKKDLSPSIGVNGCPPPGATDL
ncbi:hypothetical protein [Providencia phage PSTCR5]|uniref:Uncharacterized protein n=1 Tax=Providencia phage PSTCR5 TaxID=2783547 RepID=A0A873WNJ1_9CAUD|nr:hypothetical protein KNV68_gp071 [Providencia phage PSTCR5]QPB12169.1 hypothetical protein [Providencia phage PSTCR5]